MFSKLAIAIASPDLQGRTRLREVLKSIIDRPAIDLAKSLEEIGESIRRRTEPLHFLFVSSLFPKDKVEEFISGCPRRIANEPYGKIVFFTRKSKGMTSDIATLYMGGADGFIAEPFTPNDLNNLLAAIFEKQKKAEEDRGKVAKASEFLLSDAMSQLDELADRERRGEKGGGYALQGLKGLGEKLSSIVTTDPELYIDVMARVFERAKPAVYTARAVRKKVERVIHPGFVVLERMTTRKLDRDKFLGLARIDPGEFDKLVKGEIPLDEHMARELSRLLGMTSKEWLALQKRYDLTVPPTPPKT